MAIMLTVTEYEAEKIIASDIYEAVIDSISSNEGEYGDYIRINFSISEGVYKGLNKSIITSKRLSRSSKGNSKLLQIVETALKNKLNQTDSFDLESLIGKPVRIFLGKPFTKEGKEIQRIEQVIETK